MEPPFEMLATALKTVFVAPSLYAEKLDSVPEVYNGTFFWVSAT